MSASTRKNDATPDTSTTIHPLSPEDSAEITALLSMTNRNRERSGNEQGIEIP
ncbi:MAG: hypothetical protein WAN10_13865 [Candidatus Acidiferrales bacterium]